MSSNEYPQPINPYKYDHLNLSESFCSGYPYLNLQLEDLSMDSTNKAYDNLASLAQKSALDNTWQNQNHCFFDLHPQFSNGEYINGLLGLHLSLIIYHNPSILRSSPNLYFDIHDNWDFSPVYGRTYQSIASWIRVPKPPKDAQEPPQDAVSIDKEEDELLEEQSFVYLKTAIILFKGDELSRSSKYIKPSKSQSILAHYKSTQNIDSELDILSKEISIFKDENLALINQGKFSLDTSTYFFAVCFCKQFGFQHQIFLDSIQDLTTTFSEKSDIIKYINIALSHIDSIRIRIGELSENDLTHNQAIEIKKPKYKKNNDDSDSSDEESVSELENNKLLEQTELLKFPCSNTIKTEAKFFRMRSALTTNDIKLQTTSIWDFYVRLFFGSSLKNEIYNIMRSTMVDHLAKSIVMREIDKTINYDVQFDQIKTLAYDIFLQTYFQYNSSPIGNPQENLQTAKKLYGELIPPKLTDSQQREKTLMNLKAQDEYLKRLEVKNIEKLNNVIYESIGKIMAHPELSEIHGQKFNGIVYSTLTNLIVNWYLDSYYKNHKGKTLDFNLILTAIEKDAHDFNSANGNPDFFKKNPMIKESFLAEIKYFIKLKYNPLDVIDLSKSI